MGTFYITISNGLLDGDHQKRMGSAVWQFMWLIDKITRIEEDGWGWVLGGKPINLKDIARGVTENTVSRNLQRLERQRYISITHTPYGIIVKVARAKKRFNKNVEPLKERIINNGEPTSAKMANPIINNGEPNKTVAVDSNSKTIVGKADQPFSLKEYCEKMKSDPRRQLQIIAMYWEAKEFKFDMREKASAAIVRELRPAKLLGSYADERIEEVFEWLKKNADFKWTLETAHKYIDEDLVKMSEIKRKMSGEFHCQWGFWHKKGQICGHTYQDKIAICR